MKRNPNITPLSRDHHFGLLCSWKIREGLKKNIRPERISDYLLYFWSSHLKTHFEEEEQLLFTNTDDPLTSQALNEHKHLRLLMERIKENPEESVLADFAGVLQEHIRFEERVLFPHLEKSLSEAELVSIGAELDRIHQHQTDDYKDEFWR